MDAIITSWELNAAEWIKTITKQSINSRRFTNKAILDTISTIEANSVVDIGCGEGWLTAALTNSGKKVIGIDAIETLLKHARTKSDAQFYKMTFEDITAGSLIPGAPFDLAVFNFCLYQKDGLVALLEQTKSALVARGSIIIQTLHPYFLIAEQLPYKSQWVKDSWKGLEGNFINGHSWFARTFEDWSSELHLITNTKVAFKEVVNTAEKPVSLIITITKTT